MQYGETRWTFRELNRRANRRAHDLRRKGVGPNTLVGIHLDRKLDMLSVLLGVLKAGGAYVPLDRRWPTSRLARVIADARLSTIVTDLEGASSLPVGVDTVVCVDRSDAVDRTGGDTSAVDQSCNANPPSLTAPGDLAYVIYTSGSTGEPKGVLIQHRPLVNYVWGVLERLELRSLRTFAMVQPLSVDSSVTTFYASLLAGGCLHMIPEDHALDPVALSSYFAAYPIDFIKIAPSHLRALNAELPQPLMPRKLLLVGGEASRREWIFQLRIAAPDCRIVNHYGPTEATVGATIYAFTETDHATHSVTVPIGRPLPNVRTYVLDDHRRPAPLGVTGELYLGGDGLARGYLNQPELTAQYFVPDPFGRNGGTLYRTGDRARYLPTGDLKFLGRRDLQVKVRGYRVEVGEIEAAIAGHPAITDAAVTTEDTAAGEVMLVAAVVTREQQGLTLSALRRFLKERLPHYMLPGALVVVDALPRTAHGKLDRAAIQNTPRELDRSEPNAGSENNAEGKARTTVERALVDIWCLLLNLEGVGIHDNFFDAGGHSLSVMQVINRIRVALDVDLPIRAAFEHPTIAELAEVIETSRAQSAPG